MGLSVAASTALAFDSGSEPVYRLLPEIALAGADLPETAPGFVTTDMQDGKSVLRWGQLFRIAGDPRVYGRFSGREVALTDTGGLDQRLARSPNGLFLALMPADGGTDDAGVQIYPMSGDAPAAAVAVSDVTSDACGANVAPAAERAVAAGAEAPQAELLSASWADDYILAVTWQLPLTEAAATAEQVEAVFQVMADGQPYLTSCRSVGAGAGPVARYTPQRDLVARLRTLTFVRLPVMAEPSGGTRPSPLVSGPGPAFSTLDAGDPVVRTALSGSQAYLAVVAAVPPPIAVAARQPATSVRQQPGIRAPAPFSTSGLRGNSAALFIRNRGGEGGGGEGRGGRENGSGG